MDAAPQPLGDFLKEQTWFFGLWGHAEIRILSHTQRWHGCKPNCAVSKVRCLQSVCPPWPLTRFVAHASFKGTSSSDSWTVGVLMYVLPYLWSHLDSVSLLMPNTPKIILSAPDKRDTKVGFQRIPFFFPSCWILFAAPLLIPRSFKMTSLQVCHQINSTILHFFFPSKKYY